MCASDYEGCVHVLYECFNLQLQIGADPDHLPSDRQVRVDDPTNMNPLLQE